VSHSEKSWKTQKKKMKSSNNFNEFRFGETTNDRLELLMEVLLKYNLNGKKFWMNVNSFLKQSVFLYKRLTDLP
jgi:hypothetical protein